MDPLGIWAIFPRRTQNLWTLGATWESVDGSCKSSKSAREIRKLLYFAGPQKLKWGHLLDEKGLLSFFEHLAARGIKAPGRLTKMERACDALKYMRFCIRTSPNRRNEEARSKIAQLDAIEEMLTGWKTNMRRQKMCYIQERVHMVPRYFLRADYYKLLKTCQNILYLQPLHLEMMSGKVLKKLRQ